ncbi:LacI family DNA-binding transcriptional regulator [Kitasatospora sp. NBC_00240]|uniref:LacI family DNA-binding transcriptional regulator n=1 Tax=Kitasatospora sp. NBC_00240 TaxID=2903567 RepID=UPI002B1DD753|nr:LacI family DNA-binding transcriptional regulator [Kitasatospora sp. NBC_00240]
MLGVIVVYAKEFRRGAVGRMVSEARPETRKKRATIWEVARFAGVSHQTVSRYLRNQDSVRPATREKIDKAVEELDYRPNLVARSMRTNRSNRIAIVLPALTNFVPVPVLRGASQVAREAGYSMDVMGLEGDAARRAAEVVALLDGQQVDGVLSLTPLSEAVIAAAGGRPVLVYGEYDDNLHARGQFADGAPAGDIVRHLAELGHRRFLHVAGSPDWASALNRRAVYEETVAALGLESYGVHEGDWSVSSGYLAAQELPADSGVTAVLAANDFVAMGVIRGFQDRGMDVPGDVSVFGWDNEQFTQYFRPSISTVGFDREALGRRAMASLLALVAGEPQSTSSPSTPFELLSRGSSGPAPH